MCIAVRGTVNTSTRSGAAAGLSTLSTMGLISRMRNACIAPTTAINTTLASVAGRYGRM